MNGYTREELIGRSVTTVIHPDCRRLYREFVRTIAREGSASARATNVRKDGTSFPVDVQGTVMVYDGALHILGVARDVTEKVHAYELLEQRVEERTRELSAWNAELEARVAERTRDIERYSQELTNRVLQAQEAERKRIARELHDDTAQSLSSLLISLDLLESHLPQGEPARRVEFDRVRDIARRALDSTRTLAHGLRPTILDDFGLDAALEWIAVDHGRTFGVPVTVEAEEIPTGRLVPEVELALFRIAQEALANSGRHAEAASVHIALSSSPDAVELVVEDDGKGFDVQSLAGPSQERGLGLHGIEERVQLLGAALDVLSAPEQGTRIRVTVPLVSDKVPSSRQPAAVGTGE
jgi:signal transduction histidine kinase